jgi:hypothetical protein
MTNHRFNAPTTTPSLGATDLANLMGAGFVIGFGGLGGETKPKARRSLMGLLRKLAAFRPGARNAL